MPQHYVGIRQSWHTWHTRKFPQPTKQPRRLLIPPPTADNLHGFEMDRAHIMAQDEIIRRFLIGFFAHRTLLEEVHAFSLCVLLLRISSLQNIVIKRRANIVAVAMLLEMNTPQAYKKYWITGFAEELLSLLLKQPVKLEIQTYESLNELTFKRV